MHARILIVGGGVMGTALALRAAQRTDPLKEPVVLCERRELGAGSTGASGAILRQFYADRLLSLMARDSLREYARFETLTARAIGFHASGILTLAGPEQVEWHERIDRISADLSGHGVEIRAIGAQEIRRCIPGIVVRDGSRGAWEPTAGFVDPRRTVEAFAALARTYGAITRLGTEVEELLIEGGRAVGARTSDGEVEARRVVVMNGPWAKRLLARSGIELPLRVVVPENAFFALPESRDEPAGPTPTTATIPFGLLDRTEVGEHATSRRGTHPVLIDLEAGFYVRCEPAQDRVRVGRIDYDDDLTLEDPDDKPDTVREGLRDWAREKLAGRLPEHAARADAGALTSWYTLAPDAQPLIGPIPGVEGLFVAAGFSGHGFKLAPSVAEGVTQMLFDEPVTAFEPDFFAPARFASGVRGWSGRFGF